MRQRLSVSIQCKKIHMKSTPKVRKTTKNKQFSFKWCEALSFNSFFSAKCGILRSTRSDVPKHCLLIKRDAKDFVTTNLTPVKVQMVFQLSPVFFMTPSLHNIAWKNSSKVLKNTAKNCHAPTVVGIYPMQENTHEKHTES